MKNGSNDDLLDIIDTLERSEFIYLLVVGKVGEDVTRVWSNAGDYGPEGDSEHDGYDVMDMAWQTYRRKREMMEDEI